MVIYENRGFSVSRLQNIIQKPVNKTTLRQFAKTPIVRRAIRIKKNGLLNLKWQVTKKDINSEENYDDAIKQITACLEKPNNGDTFRSLFGAVIEDIETGDCGAVEVLRTASMERPIQLFGVDGFTIEYNANWNNDTKVTRYLQKRPDNNSYIELLDEDLMYMKSTDLSYDPLGYSPVESAFKLINYLLNAQDYAGFVTSKAIPKYILNLGKQADSNVIASFRKYFDEEVYGTGIIPIIGGSEGIQTHQLTAVNDDGLYLQWQHFLITVIAYCFDIDPKRLNEGSQTDRSTVEEQKENINDEAIKPLARVIEENINAKVIGRLGLSDFLKFEFIFEENESQKAKKSTRLLGEYAGDVLTCNEVRKLLGYDESDDKYANMRISEYKAAVNSEYNISGGYNGVGKNRYDNGNSDPKGGDNN